MPSGRKALWLLKGPIQEPSQVHSNMIAPHYHLLPTCLWALWIPRGALGFLSGCDPSLQSFVKELICADVLECPISSPATPRRWHFCATIGGSKAQFGIGFVVMLKIFLGVRRDTSTKLQLGGETLYIQVNNSSPPCLRKKIYPMRSVGVSLQVL